jgi:hypothetical protein
VDGDEFYNATMGSINNNLGPGFDLSSLQHRCDGDGTLLSKHNALLARLEKRLGSSLYGRFPPQDRPWIKERILFLLSPLPTQNDTVSEDFDCAKAFYQDGYGAGLSSRQALLAIQALRHLLVLHPLEAAQKKPPLSFFYRDLCLDYDSLHHIRDEMGHRLVGTPTTDAATFAFLRSINVTSFQSEILLHAFSPSLLSFHLKPSWELSQKSLVRKSFLVDSLYLLQMRLGVTPALFYSMLESHPRLSGYSFSTMLDHLNTLQSTTGLSSSQLRKLVLCAPPILGVSSKKLAENVAFLNDTIGGDSELLQKVIMKDPSFLQRSMKNNLAPKIEFLKNTIGFSDEDIHTVLNKSPSILGASMSKRMVPAIMGFQSTGFDAEDVRAMIFTEPRIIALPWKTLIAPKISYFLNRIGLDQTRKLLRGDSRVLLHSIRNSLEPKIQMLEEASPNVQIHLVSKVIAENPALLLVSKAKLQQRLVLFSSKSIDEFEDYFARREERRSKDVILRRRTRTVVEYDESMRTVLRTFESVRGAAEALGNSQAYMYNILKNSRLHKGKRYRYGEPTDTQWSTAGQLQVNGLGTRENVTSLLVGASSVLDFKASNALVDILRDRSSTLRNIGLNLSDARITGGDACYLCCFCAASAYPWKKSSQSPVQVKAGGAALYIPQFPVSWKAKIEDIVTNYLGLNTLKSNNDNGNSQSYAPILMEYKYQRPSQNRCSIFVCLEVLRIVARLLSLHANENTSFTNSTVTIDIFTDSTYALETLSNSSALLQWGNFANRNDFEESLATLKVHNKDILYPLARIYSTLRKQAIFHKFAKKHGKRFAKEICIRFRHISELAWNLEDPIVSSMGDYAKEAAMMEYKRKLQLTRNELLWRENARFDVFYF